MSILRREREQLRRGVELGLPAEDSPLPPHPPMGAQVLTSGIMARGFVIQEGEEKDLFFDSREEITSIFDSCPGSPSKNDSFLEEQIISRVPPGPQFDFWLESPDCVRERREKFMKWMDMDLFNYSDDIDGEMQVDEMWPVADRIASDCGALLSASDREDKYSTSSRCRLDDGTVFILDEMEQDGGSSSIAESDSIEMETFNELVMRSGSNSSSCFRWLEKRGEKSSSKSDMPAKKKRLGWLRKLGALVCIPDKQHEKVHFSFSGSRESQIARTRRVKVRSCKKNLKEFSAVYKRQDIKAHDGAILTMKFSPDGQYLATGGTDGIVRVWRVMKCDMKAQIRNLDDPYFTVDHNAELKLRADEDKKSKSNRMRRSADSSRVVFPRDGFWLCKEPVHVFHGHDADVLDLSWSTNKHILSSSKDTTVRLWKVGSDSCLKVFSHRDYVTCVQFNPIDENFFVSGSIDGKVRIWDISGCQVVNWVDIKEIVTAICYQPNGKGVVVGTLNGKCRFYDISSNHLQIEAKVSLQGKQKPPYKQITGFQFCPKDPKILMVTSADSQIRILNGIDVVSKYKGFHNSGSQISAYFTADGKHIISASEDCNVCVWNHDVHDASMPNHAKNIWSREQFFSSNSSIAIPWDGFSSMNQSCPTSKVLNSRKVHSEQFRVSKYSKCGIEDSCGSKTLHLSSSGGFTLHRQFISDLLPKGSATWPEEKLPLGPAAASLSESTYKFLKTSSRNTSHAWGQVIVTAGGDGCIRSYQNYGLPVYL